MTEECNLAIYIESDPTLGEASDMIDKLLSDDRVMLSEKEIVKGYMNMIIAFKDSDTEDVRKLCENLGFKEDWDEMNEWDPYYEPILGGD